MVLVMEQLKPCRFLLPSILLALLLVLTTACLDDQPNSLEQALANRDGFVYNPDSPYANAVKRCLTQETYFIENSCTIDTLPPLGYPDGEPPTIDEIMDRVYVSHGWMGDNFRALLETMPDDMRYLLRSITGIAIHKDVRPSFYTPRRGMIAIDPDLLWLTPGQRKNIDLNPDHRSAWGQTLQFDIPYRYIKDNAYAFERVPLTAESVEPRELEDLRLRLAQLMYHELAHAADFLAPERIPNLDGDSYIAEVMAETTPPDCCWIGLDPVVMVISATLSLDSDEMKGLAKVRYQGQEATDAENNYQPSDVAGFFEPDAATHWYNYVSPQEDFAMMFENIMMQHHFGLDFDMAITNRRPEDGTGEDMIVTWGQRNRVGASHIRERMAEPLESVFWGLDVQDILPGLPEPTPLVANASWHANLDPDTLTPKQAATKARAVEDTQPVRH